MNKDITAKLNTRGFVSRAAAAIGLSPSTISQVIAGNTISLPTASKIAKLVGHPVQDVFPDIVQYQPNYNLKVINAQKREVEVNKFREQLAS
jgi:plasmid maintenance system antidote protein VapI